MSRVFICDDERSYRYLVRTVLDQDADFDVVGEGDGCECAAMAAAAGADVILLDINMPGLNGIDALPLLRRKVPDATILMLTSADEPSARKQAEEAGAHGFLRKPSNALDLPGMIRARLAAA